LSQKFLSVSSDKKYNLSPEEIGFIESMIKPMG